MYKSFFKYLFDFITSVILLLLSLPLTIPICILLSFNNKSKVFYLHERPGYKTKPFKLIKFKTMNDKIDKDGNLLSDVERITTIGRILRKFSLDELPQIINVLKGDMSLIGPRPLLFKYIHLYNEEQRRRHEVLPGITGWAQVNGRNSITWFEKFKYDIYYVDNVSFLFDLKILLLTLKKVFMQEGINQTEERPMKPFDGTN